MRHFQLILWIMSLRFYLQNTQFSGVLEVVFGLECTAGLQRPQMKTLTRDSNHPRNLAQCPPSDLRVLYQEPRAGWRPTVKTTTPQAWSSGVWSQCQRRIEPCAVRQIPVFLALGSHSRHPSVCVSVSLVSASVITPCLLACAFRVILEGSWSN